MGRLPLLHRLIDAGTRVPLLRRRSFVHELHGKHEQQILLGGGYTAWDAQHGLRFEYVVPERICRGSGREMPLSAILALVDEATTWASIGADRFRRPGASLALDARLIDEDRPPQAGERLFFESRPERIGRTIGFETCTVHDAATGRLVASASHVKYLDMGRAWDTIMGPLFPLAAALADVAKPRAPPEVLLNDAAAFETLISPAHCETSADGRAVAKFTVGPRHLQERGVLFGGCHAMFHERAGAAAAMSRQAAAQGGALTALRLCSMRVNFLGAATDGARLEAHATSSPSWRGVGRLAHSRLMLAESGSLRSEARMEFILAES